MGDRNQELKSTRRRPRRDVFKGPIHGFIHHAGGRGEVIAYNEYTEVRGTSSARVVHKSDTPFNVVGRFGGEPQPRESIYENRDNPLRGRRGIQQAQRPPLLQDRDVVDDRAIVEDLLRRAARAGPGRSMNQVRARPAIEPGNPENRGSDERIPKSENGAVFNFRLLEQEFDKLSPDMQRYLIWLQKTTKNEHLFAHRDQANVYEDLSQR